MLFLKKMQTPRALITTLVFVFLTAEATQAPAAVVRQADLGELVDASAVVFHGVVSRVEDSPASRTGRFVTQIDFEVLESVTGLETSQRVFSLQVPGGRRGSKSLIIPGMPRFIPGDEVVLLLEKRQGQPGWMFTGLAQGVFWVRRDQVVPLAYRNLSNITLVREGEHLHGGVERPQSLHGLLDILRKLVEGVR